MTARSAWSGALVCAVALLMVHGAFVDVAHGGDDGLVAQSAGKVGTFRIGYNDPKAAAAEAAKRRVIILNADQSHLIPQIKETNPKAVVLAYKCLSSARNVSWSYNAATKQDKPELTTGVGYGEAERDHPEWFLEDTAGQRLEWNWYPGHWQMDVGNASYQNRWISNVKADLAGEGWDGVFLDNANWRRNAYNDPGPAKYRTDTAMRAAMRSMLAKVGPALRQAGLLTIANIGEARLADGLYADWISLVDGAMNEHFVNWGTKVGGPFVWDWPDRGWRSIVNEVATAARLGKIAMIRIGGVEGDINSLRYGLGSFLLAADGRAVFAPPAVTSPPWYPEFNWDLGTPKGPYYAVAGKRSVYRRDFTAGTVVVNASEATSATVDLGATYLTHSGTRVSRVTLGGTRAAILRAPVLR